MGERKSMLITLLIVWFLIIPIAAVAAGFIVTRVRDHARSGSSQRPALVQRRLA